MTKDPLDDLVTRWKLSEEIFVARPTMPPLDRFQESLARNWESRWLTNNGPFHQRFEASLCSYLGADHVSVFCNGTIALLVALQALRITSGEVITTPFTFPATPHVLHWNGVTPVFCDIDPETFNLDPAKIESLITPRTLAIMPVHVFGNPCDVDGIQAIADKHGLKVVYDSAHAFGVKVRDRSLTLAGDLNMLSFHATKLFSSIEGGALVSGSARLKTRIDFLKNFGIADEETVVGPGINGKMNELQSAFGLLHLEMVEREIAERRKIVELYRAGLARVPGLRLQRDLPNVRHNDAYFPVLVEAGEFGMDRDTLHKTLKRFNIYTRRYFHPLCSHIPSYQALPSASADRLPIAESVARRILCLPIYGTLAHDHVRQICGVLSELHRAARLRG
jgi:dTDP-4-amino-4,6-dideoxygalactose transaminase